MIEALKTQVAQLLPATIPASAATKTGTSVPTQAMEQLALESMSMVVVRVTHGMGFARHVADRVIFMDGGKVVEMGSPTDIFDNPQHERTKAFLRMFLTQNGNYQSTHASPRASASHSRSC
jgi:ABC-type histidine transport system ATPase subunit